MWMTAASKKYRSLLVAFTSGILLLNSVSAIAGSYLESGHGNATYGVDRSAIDGTYADYATGNCSHCHEAHSSVEGAAPAPVAGPDSHTLFAPGFNSDRTLNPYLETDSFCFYCHSDVGGPQVTNQDYSAAFGGATVGSGPQSIMSAFNQQSYHNLYDIWSFLRNNPIYSAWFIKRDNPCSACHNSHLAKRNWDSGQPAFPLLSTISIPGLSNYLWGETELMSSYLNYEAPFAFVAGREPAGIGDQNGTNTPNYVGFCTSCHNPDNTIWSTTLDREIKKVDWGDIGMLGDKHGAQPRDGVDQLREPYATSAATKSNFVLSCLDCHESHGSPNTMMLRRRINGEELEGIVISTDTMSYVCKRCHNDDLAAVAGTGEADRWEYVHHGVADAPYAKSGCAGCHGGGSPTDPPPIACGNCHGHGLDDSWLPGGLASGRKTF